MPNIPDSRAPATARFELPDEKISAVTGGLSKLSKAIHEKDEKEKQAENARKQKLAITDVDSVESAKDEGFIEGVKSDLRDASEFMQEKLRDIDLYEEMSEFTSGLYQGIREQLGFTDSSPAKIDEEIKTAYEEQKAGMLARQNFRNEDEVAAFSQRFDEKARFDQQSLRASKQQILKERIHATVDRHIEKYGSGVVTNPDTLTDAIIVIDSNINDLAPGIGREVAVEKSREARRSFLSFALQGHAKQGNYDALQSLLDGVDPATGAEINIDEYVNNEDKGYFQSIASKGIVRNEATKLLDDISAAGLSEEHLLRTLEYYPDQLIGKEANLLWKNQRRLQAKEQRERIKGQRYSGWNYLVENKGNIDVNDLSLDLSDEDRETFIRYVDELSDRQLGLYRPDHSLGKRAVYEVKKLQLADPENFGDRDLSDYFKFMSPHQIGQAVAMQEGELDARDAANFKMRDRVAFQAWKAATGKSVLEQEDKESFIDFRINLDERVDEHNGTQEEPATPTDVERIANDMAANGEMVQPEREGDVIRGGEGRDVFGGSGGESLNEYEELGNHKVPINDIAHQEGLEGRKTDNNLINGMHYSNFIRDALATNLRLDKSSPENQQAVDMYYNSYEEAPLFKAAPASEQNKEISALVNNLGILPSSVKKRTIDDINSGDPDRILRAADLNTKLENLEIEVSLDIADFEQSRLRMISTMIGAGVEPKDAVERAKFLADPANEKLIQTRTKKYEEMVENNPFGALLSGYEFSAGNGYLTDFFKPYFAEIPLYLREELEVELNGLLKREYLLTGDIRHPNEYAQEKMVKNWGQSIVNGSKEFMKHPPEMYYTSNGFEKNDKGIWGPQKRRQFKKNYWGNWGHSNGSISDQNAATHIADKLEKDLISMGVPKDVDTFLVADDRTDDEARNNLFPSYKIQFSDLKQSSNFSLEDYRWNPRDGFFAIK
ncbi:hypothetical protein WH96_06370 [Kiloniella spongiae]|uniref:Uncharacterized protein n=1 Tax=Kiloniella spongiae TaxID=1489064 RepID=A0A0H2MMF5_9PROT|nr:hypothetical protein [Kiloniella spongiae]KLN61897.1 hypothetical protein WH96_06370 [Kiloniella spongiae]